jgi:hypothetical protein
MKISQALLRNIFVFQITMLLILIVVHGEKVSMDNSDSDNNNNIKNNENKNDTVERELIRRSLFESSNNNNNDDLYPYSRNYVAIIEPENFVSLSTNGGGGIGNVVFDDYSSSSSSSSSFNLQGTSIIISGNVYDPADIVILNKLNGVEITDPGIAELIDVYNNNGHGHGTTGCEGRRTLYNVDPYISFIGRPYAGNRQPKFPIPPGDKSYFFHGGTYAHNNNNNIENVFLFFIAHRI